MDYSFLIKSFTERFKACPKQKKKSFFEFSALNLVAVRDLPISCHMSLSIPLENIKKLYLIFSGAIKREQRHEMG